MSSFHIRDDLFLPGDNVSKWNFSPIGKNLKSTNEIIYNIYLHVRRGQTNFVKLENYTWFACQENDNFQDYI